MSDQLSIPERLEAEADRSDAFKKESTNRLLRQAAYRIRDLEHRLRLSGEKQ